MLEVQGSYNPLPGFPRASRCLQLHKFSVFLVVIFQLLGLHNERSILLTHSHHQYTCNSIKLRYV
jgi:hypothetical protein